MATIGNTTNQKILDEKDWFYGFVGKDRVNSVVLDPKNDAKIKEFRMKRGVDLYGEACDNLEQIGDKNFSELEKQRLVDKSILLFYAIEVVQRVTEKTQTKYYGKVVDNVDIYALSDETCRGKLDPPILGD